jgi:predicted TIM-barrel fold metal-dependent hydrolase
VQNSMQHEWLISVDDHIIEPPNVWIDRLPARYQAMSPRWITDEAGSAWLFGESERCPSGGSIIAGAIARPQDRPDPFRPLSWDEIPPAAYDAKARVAAMDQDHVAAALLFGTLPGFDGNRFSQHPDKAFALLCLQAYNDWLLDEFCASHPGRFIGLALVPMWDAKLAAAEAERAVRKGARAVSFSMAPHNLGFPPIWDPGCYWDPLFAFMNEVNLPLCAHLGTDFNGDILTASLSKMGSGNSAPGAHSIMSHLSGQQTLAEWLGSGNFERFPNLKVALSENGIGWIPTILQRADWVREMAMSRTTIPSDAENDPMYDEEARSKAAERIALRAREATGARLPSELVRNHVYGCFIKDEAGLRQIDLIGEDNIMIETDFPHNSTQWPHTMYTAQAALAGLSDKVRHKILRGNAMRVFDFTPAEVPATVA